MRRSRPQADGAPAGSGAAGGGGGGRSQGQSREPGRVGLGQSQGESPGQGRRAGITSSSLWLRMPRTRSCRFLSNMRSMLPLTILRAIAAAAAGLEPREAHGRPQHSAPRAGRTPRPGRRRVAGRRLPSLWVIGVKGVIRAYPVATALVAEDEFG